MTPARPHLLINPAFARFWWSNLLSWTGNGALFVALPVQVYGTTRSTLVTALVVMVGALPAVLVGPLAGALVDRLDRRRTLIWTNLALCGMTFLFLLTPHAPWGRMVVITFLVSSVKQLLGPAENALLPGLVDAGRLGRGNSLNALSSNVARLIGPALGGVTLAQLGFRAVIGLDALSFAAAGLLLTGLRGEARVPLLTPGQGAGRHGWWSGFTAVRASRALRVLFLAGAVVAFGEGFISTLLAPFVQGVLGGSGQTLGLMLSVQAVGGALGAWWVGRVGDRRPVLELLALGALSSGVLLVVIFNYALVYRAVWPAIAFTGVAGFPFAVFGIAQTLGLQRWAPQAAIGRVFGASAGLSGLTVLLGMGVSGLLGAHLGPLVINVDAATYLLAGVIASRAISTRSGRLRTPPPGRQGP